MAKRDFLFTSEECIQLLILAPHFDRTLLNSFIVSTIGNWVKPALCDDLYDVLLANKQVIPLHNSGITYVAGVRVWDETRGLCYVSVDFVPQGASLDNLNYWAVSEPFTVVAYQDLWRLYLNAFCADAVAYEASPSIMYRIQNAGITKSEGDSYEVINPKELGIWQTAQKRKIQGIREMMEKHIKQNESDFPDYCHHNKGCAGEANETIYSSTGIILDDHQNCDDECFPLYY